MLAIDSFGIAVDEISLISLQTNELRGDFVVLADTHNSNLQHVSSTMGLFGADIMMVASMMQSFWKTRQR